jgi:hypothetical protein
MSDSYYFDNLRIESKFEITGVTHEIVIDWYCTPLNQSSSLRYPCKEFKLDGKWIIANTIRWVNYEARPVTLKLKMKGQELRVICNHEAFSCHGPVEVLDPFMSALRNVAEPH